MNDETPSFFNIVYNHLFGIIKLATERRDIELHTDTLISILKRRFSDDIKDFYDERKEKDDYGRKIHKVKTIMLCLYDIDVLPISNLENERRYYNQFNPDQKGVSQSEIENDLIFKDLLMKYYYFLSRLSFKGDDMEALKYYLDIAYALLSPYITENDRERWELSNYMIDIDIEDYGIPNMIDRDFNEYNAVMLRIEILSEILGREGFQFKERTIDEMDISNLPTMEEIEDESELYS